MTDWPALPAFERSPGLRAAQYVRMSTDHQKYSTQNQAEAIAAYAARRELTIVRTYADEGRSGLRLVGREALLSLINDVRCGRADFEFILVYDVSRWGRFQDADESAYYEFICKEAGIRVLYCAEEFENDGSFASTMQKFMKRAMAAEFSRDLSRKVFAGKCRLIQLGFWQGGPPGYGLRRELIGESRVPKALLAPGERKSIQTDRVVLTPGPTHEQEVVRRIFASFATGRKAKAEIAAELNSEQIHNSLGKPWNSGAIHKILTSERYLGHNVFNHASFKLRQHRIVNPPSMWVRRDNAFEGIVEPSVFVKAQEIIAERKKGLSDQQMLDKLRSLWREKGYLSKRIIRDAEGIPDRNSYATRFGSLVAAYKLIGFQPRNFLQFADAAPNLRTTLSTVVQTIISNIESGGGSAAFNARARVLTINDRFTVSLGVAWCQRTDAGRLRWKVRINRVFRSDMVLVIRMNEANDGVRDYYLLPTAKMLQCKIKKFYIANRVFADAYRHTDLDVLFRLSAHGVP